MSLHERLTLNNVEGELHPNVQREMERFGSSMWRGAPLRVVQPTILKPGGETSVKFEITTSCLPFDGALSTETMEMALEPHVRSRGAHLAVDLPDDIGERVVEVIAKNPPSENRPTIAELAMVNHGSRSILLPVNSSPWHLFVIPEAARVRGEELEDMVGKLSSGKAVEIDGEKDTDWRMWIDYSTRHGKVATGLLLPVDPDERYWIPDSPEIITLDESGTFKDARERYFRELFKRVDDPQYPMPPGRLWVGKGPHMKIHSGLYAVISENAYGQVGRRLRARGLHSKSPLLEGGRTDHQPHYEVKGPIDWIRLSIVRNGTEAKAG